MENATEKRQILYDLANELLDKSERYSTWYLDKSQQHEVEDSIKEVLRALESDEIVLNPIIDELSQNLVNIVGPIIDDLEIKNNSKSVRQRQVAKTPRDSPAGTNKKKFDSKRDLLDELQQLEEELAEKFDPEEKTLEEIQLDINTKKRCIH
jgi:hypothetical protein